MENIVLQPGEGAFIILPEGYTFSPTVGIAATLRRVGEREYFWKNRDKKEILTIKIVPLS